MSKLQSYRYVFHYLNKINLLLALCLCSCGLATGQYYVRYQLADSNAVKNIDRFKAGFPTQKTAMDYINTLPSQMAALGYFSASADSVAFGKDTALVKFYLGDIFSFYNIKPNEEAQKIMTANGIVWKKKTLPADLERINNQLLDRYENTGRPFAAVMLDSMQWVDNNLNAVLRIDPGATYKIDSMHVMGRAKINSAFLQRYLRIPNGSRYNRQSLDQISQRISELPFLQETEPWRLSMLTGGSVVNLYLEPKRSSQVYVLIGLLPANEQSGSSKLMVTGEANINLKNALGAGESIGINWQQIQYKSPRINLQYQHPYILKSSFGLDAGFELFKKDTQWVNINARIGVLYELSARQTGKVILQSLQTNVTYVDTNIVRNLKQLPPILDVSSINLGVDYAYNNTNYRFNPRRGWDIFLQVNAGTKKIKRNNEILKLKDRNNPAFNFASLYDSVKTTAYQLRIKSSINYYLPLGRQTVLKTALQTGWYQSPDIFRNELFQIGGYRLLRGFDEESIYANLYSVLTAEVRYLINTNSYFFAFGDGGYANYKQRATQFSHTYIGAGLGLAFETGNSLINISLAAGKRDDLPLNLRQSKIHIGFVNFF
ncbi:MAG: BamA/TamA family outer membrane protein [Bacteroidota bacterium]